MDIELIIKSNSSNNNSTPMCLPTSQSILVKNYVERVKDYDYFNNYVNIGHPNYTTVRTVQFNKNNIHKIKNYEMIRHCLVRTFDGLLSSDEKEGFNDSLRGAGFLFGADISSKFIHSNNLGMICRAHQMVVDGYSWAHEKNVCTVFSAPNYCYRCGNKAGIMEVDENLNTNLQQYEAAPKRGDEGGKYKRMPDYFL